MLGASFLPSRFRSADSPPSSANPSWSNRQITPVLQSVSRRACTHPIHTTVFVALLASTTYIGLLEGSLFETTVKHASLGKADFGSLLTGSRNLRLGPETGWKWQVDEAGATRAGAEVNGRHSIGIASTGTKSHVSQTSQDLALLTFVFPETSATTSTRAAPAAQAVPVPSNSSAELLPCSTNPLSPVSHDTTLAFSIPYVEAPEFLSAVQEIPIPVEEGAGREGHDSPKEQKRWIMEAAKGMDGRQGGLRSWASNSWTAFVDLLKNAETLDIVIMVLGYLAMHLTFVSLFLSMRRLGSNFWLATTVLFSSCFAFLFGLIVTTKLGVPVNMVLLSEGLPFLVVTIGFEKPIILTKAVLSASLNARRQATSEHSPMTIQDAVQTAVKERGFEIVKDYCIEIMILTAGAFLGVQGGLRQFCFLAAWILFFDCILLFTFYTSILTIKLEINRIKRHVALRKALEEDGVSRTVAENVASSNDWPQLSSEAENGTNSQPVENTVFGRKVRDTSIPKFKVLMVTGFILINVLNLATLPFRGGSKHTSPTMSGLSGVQPPIDPFKVAGNGLDAIFESARNAKIPTTVTVLAPIKYELEFPSVHYGVNTGSSGSILDGDHSDQLLEGMGGRVVEGVLKSLEDPVLSKWIIVVLALSLALNGYLFNAARWTIKEPSRPSAQPSPTTEGPPTDVASGSVVKALPTAEKTINQSKPLVVANEHVEEVMASPESKDVVGRTLEDAERLVKEKKASQLTDPELVTLSLKGTIPGYALEKTLGNMTRAVKIRRSVISRTPATKELSNCLEKSLLPYEHFDYERVFGACCENVIGYMPLPLGVAGPINIDGTNYFLPMATTEGVLVASTSRGCKAINAGGGAVTVLTGDGMTRGPCVTFSTLARAGAAKVWLDSEEGGKIIKTAFDSTSRFARLQHLKTALAGTNLYIRFKTTTGDAMGMNMISKGVEHALKVMSEECGFEDMNIVSLSGNYCIDKKAAAINWIDGRGKSVVAEAIVPAEIVKSVLKSDVDSMVELNTSKNLIGSALAGAMGGFNAHAANIVAAIFIATGQDPAQVVESANCITTMRNFNGNLQIAVSMPSIEVGTIGGGTILEPQSAMLDLLGVRGPHPTTPGANARQLARIVAAGVLAGELSLCGALAAGHLVKAHMAHNRSAAPSRAPTPKPNGVPPNLGMTPVSAAIGAGRDRR